MNTSGMGYKILDERYALLECLAVSGMGEIYRGRDLELAQTENAPSRILIHLLPSQYRITHLESSLQQAQNLTKKLNKSWILPILATGQSGDRAYFILQSPDGLGAHSLMSLPSQQFPLLSKLTQQFGGLVKAKQLPEIIDSALLITLPNQSLYLLATALIQPLHTLRAHHTGLSIYKRPAIKPTLALSSIMVVALSTFAVEYRGQYKAAHSAQATTPHLNSTPALLDQAEAVLYDQPVQTQTATLRDRLTKTATLPFPLTFQEPLANSEPALVALQPRKMQPAENQLFSQTNRPNTTTKKSALVEPSFSKVKDGTDSALTSKPADKKLKPPTKAKAPESKLAQTMPEPPATPKAPVIATAANTAALYHTVNIEPAPTPIQPKKNLTNVLVDLSLDDIIERANQALALGNFSQKNGVLFYARKIKIQDHLHPQVERLGRFTVMHQHALARKMLKTDEPAQAYTLLNTSKNLIQEFNLKSLNSAQQVLEHKSNQYN